MEITLIRCDRLLMMVILVFIIESYHILAIYRQFKLYHAISYRDNNKILVHVI